MTFEQIDINDHDQPIVFQDKTLDKEEIEEAVYEIANRAVLPAVFVKGEFFGTYFDVLRKSVTLEFWELLDEKEISHQFGWGNSSDQEEEKEELSKMERAMKSKERDENMPMPVRMLKFKALR